MRERVINGKMRESDKWENERVINGRVRESDKWDNERERIPRSNLQR